MATKPISETHPALAAEWHPTLNPDVTPDRVSAGSSKRIWWIDSLGHEWATSPKHRTISGSNCPYCSGNKFLFGFNDLETKFPDIAKEWHPVLNGDKTPSHVLGGGRAKFWWVGKCGHEWEAPIHARIRGSGCPYCVGSNTKVLSGFNDLETKFPDIAKEWHPTKNGDLLPEQVLAGVKLKVWWLGKCGHEWDTEVGLRVRGYGCPICAGRRTLRGFNDLKTLYPHLGEEWHPTKNGDVLPDRVPASSHDKVWWLDQYGHEWESTINKRQQGRNCPYCSGTKLLVGFNDLQSRHPDLVAEWHPTKNGNITPSAIHGGQPRSYWWLGACGHEWRQLLTSRVSGSGCPTCSIGGFRSSEAATLYFLHNPRLQAFKVGITNKNKKVDRISKFVNKGWKVVNRWESESGLIILSCETTFFQWLRRDKQIPVYLDKTDRSLSGTGGASETFSDSILTQAQVITKIEELLEMEQNI